jgi:hypothetical protein
MPKSREERLAQMRAYSNKRYHATKKLKGRSRHGVQCTEYYRAWRIKAGKCMDCDFVITKDNYYLIDADHRPGEHKRFELSKAHKYGIQSTIAELEKCDPVCCRCHRIRTFERALIHGQKGWATRRANKQQLKLEL